MNKIRVDGNIGERFEALDWECLCQELDARGSALLERVLSGAECRSLARLYDEDAAFAA